MKKQAPAIEHVHRVGTTDVASNGAPHAGGRNHDRLRDLADLVNGVYWEADPDFRKFYYVSRSIERLLGIVHGAWYAEEFWTSRVHPDDRARLAEHRQATPLPGIRYSIEYRMLAAGGRGVWIRETFQLASDAALPFITGVFLDISYWKGLADASLLAESLMRHNHDGITITDSNARILHVNEAFCDITGYRSDEIVGKTPRLLQSGIQEKTFYESMWNAIHAHGRWSGEVWNRRKSGEIYVQQLSIVRLGGQDGEVTRYLGLSRDITTTKAVEEEIARLSHFDALTGLPNRAQLQRRLQDAISAAETGGQSVAVLSVDLDRLSHINDTLGHEVGDNLLIGAANRLRDVLCDSTSVSRHIGDEFTVVLEGVDNLEALRDFSDRLLKDMSATFFLDGHEVHVTACIGISMYPKDGQTPDVLIKQANVALHHAKAHGANRLQFFEEHMDLEAMQRMRVANHLRHALRRNEIHVHYQPQVDLASGKVLGMEALARWTHPELGRVSPSEFIPIAEKNGAIIDIGFWVLKQACVDALAVHALGQTDLCVAVNVSARQFMQHDFAATVKAILDEIGFPPDKLELELTESMIMQHPERVVQVLSELRNMGVQFSIDDFGTGYSSLSQLKRFPIDKLKIDRSFICDIGDDRNGEAIARMIIALAKSMGLRTIAEGVETESQRKFLLNNGCDGMQGYLFSHPVPVADILKLAAVQEDDPC